jgi:hypothetical protein
VRFAAVAALVAVTVATGAGCGGGEAESQVALRLQREDLIAVGAALAQMQAPVAGELSAARVAWRGIANGLPHAIPPTLPAQLAAAAASADGVRLPSLLQEAQAVSLTGPAAQIAGLVRSYTLLCRRGWSQILATLAQIRTGTPAQARFARTNVALYIESVYDGHFTLAQVGSKLLVGYRKLGGSRAFSSALTEAQVQALARAYSEANARLHPHVGVRLGS